MVDIYAAFLEIMVPTDQAVSEGIHFVFVFDQYETLISSGGDVGWQIGIDRDYF